MDEKKVIEAANLLKAYCRITCANNRAKGFTDPCSSCAFYNVVWGCCKLEKRPEYWQFKGVENDDERLARLMDENLKLMDKIKELEAELKKPATGANFWDLVDGKDDTHEQKTMEEIPK